jgi:membrane protease YdiL (CAAX protease family)
VSNKAIATPVWEDRLASRLRGFGPLGIFAIVCIFYTTWYAPPLAFLMVLVWTRLSRTPWAEIGFVRPKSWARELAIGLVLGCALMLVLRSLVLPLLGADPVNHAYHFVVGNRAAIPGIILTTLFAGVGEETLFRGYLFERLSKLLGDGVGAMALIVLLTSVWFGMNHFVLLGLARAVNAAIAALVFGTIYAVTKRLWLLIAAHLAADSLAFAIIYLGLEAKVAHWVFR